MSNTNKKIAELYYNGNDIVSLQKIWNFIMGNRNSGKSFYYKELLLKRYFNGIKKGQYDCRFALFHRKVEDVKLTSPGFFDDVLSIKFKDKTIIFKATSNGFGRFYCNGNICGYSLAIKNYVTYKKMAELQSVSNILFDEFLSEKNDYLANEVDMVRNIYSTIARGGGEFVRNNVQMFFVANTVSMVNPYFKAFPEIKESFKFNTKKIVRKDFVLELSLNQNAVDALKKSKFGQSIDGTQYAAYALNNDFYLDNTTFIEKVDGQKTYVITFTLSGEDFAIYESIRKGLIYISKDVDPHFKKICCDTDDHGVNMLMVQKNEDFIKNLARLYRNACVRFEDLDCKIAFLTLVNIQQNS